MIALPAPLTNRPVAPDLQQASHGGGTVGWEDTPIQTAVALPNQPNPGSAAVPHTAPSRGLFVSPYDSPATLMPWDGWGRKMYHKMELEIKLSKKKTETVDLPTATAAASCNLPPIKKRGEDPC